MTTWEDTPRCGNANEQDACSVARYQRIFEQPCELARHHVRACRAGTDMDGGTTGLSFDGTGRPARGEFEEESPPDRG